MNWKLHKIINREINLFGRGHGMKKQLIWKYMQYTNSNQDSSLQRITLIIINVFFTFTDVPWIGFSKKIKSDEKSGCLREN